MDFASFAGANGRIGALAKTALGPEPPVHKTTPKLPLIHYPLAHALKHKPNPQAMPGGNKVQNVPQGSA